jgi:hypothetical protein
MNELFVAPVHSLDSKEIETITTFANSIQDALLNFEKRLKGSNKFVITNEIALREPSADDFEI